MGPPVQAVPTGTGSGWAAAQDFGTLLGKLKVMLL